MALLFMDSFDHYVTADILEKWSTYAGTSVAINATGGRRGSASVRFPSGAQSYALRGITTSSNTAILGTAVKVASLGAQRLIGVWHSLVASGGDQIVIAMAADGSLNAQRATAGISGPGTILGSSAAGVLSAGVVAYLEVKVVLHASTGTVTVRVNGASVLALTGLNTGSGQTTWTGFWVGSGGTAIVTDHDDVYALDGSGSAPWNDFLGDVRVDARLPTAAGATTGWTPSAGANWACVDDAAPNDDTDYVTAATAALTDTYTVQDAPVAGATIYGVQHCLSVKKTDAGACTVAPVIRSGGVDYVGTAANPGTTYGYALSIAAVNPATGVAWTEAGFNAAEFGVTRTV